MSRLALPALASLLATGCMGLWPLPLATSTTTPTPSLSTKPARTQLTILLAPSLPRPADTRAALTRALGSSFDLTFAEAPSSPPRATDTADIDAQLAAARKSYIAADFAPCLSKIGELARVTDLLAQGERSLASRLLFWRIACRVGSGRTDDARRDAEVFAALELEAPADVEAAAPDVEALIADAGRQVAAAPRLPLRVSASPATPTRAALHAVVSIDGRRALCVAPCAIDLRPGDHAVRVEADGYGPEARVVRLAEPSGNASFTLTPADPALAAEQWTARHAATAADLDSAASVALLATALRARTLAVVAIEPAPKGKRLAGVLAVDGAVASRSERIAAADGDVPGTAPSLLRDLLLRGRLIDAAPPLHKRPIFWITVGLAAVAAAAVTAALLYEPPPTVGVTL